MNTPIVVWDLRTGTVTPTYKDRRAVDLRSGLVTYRPGRTGARVLRQSLKRATWTVRRMWTMRPIWSRSALLHPDTATKWHARACLYRNRLRVSLEAFNAWSAER